jgi:phospholipase/carboxylesterase
VSEGVGCGDGVGAVATGGFCMAGLYTVRMALIHRTRPGIGPNPPLLVLLHGYGSDENDLFALAPYLDPRFHIVSVRAPRRYPPGYGWYDVAFTQAGIQVDETYLPESAAEVLALLATLKEVQAFSSVTLLGFSQGAAVALYLLLTHPAEIDAVAALSGHVPRTGWENRAEFADKPVFVAHGTRDMVVPIAAGRDAKEKLSTLPVPLSYHEYPMTHEISGETLTDLNAWLEGRL